MVVYWGRRGGGLDLFNLFVEECQNQGISVIASSRPTAIGRDGEVNLISFRNIRAWLQARKFFLRQASLTNVRSVVFIMSSPWDLFLGTRLKKTGIDVTRIIHDSKPHPGEKFPPGFWIKLLTKDCSRIVTLSNYVASQLSSIYGVNPQKIRSCRFPAPKIDYQKIVKSSPKKKILLIGRGKKYQGQQLLENAWNLIDKSNKELIIAGEGFKQNRKYSDIIYKNWWMSRNEMLEEIASSDLVVFPYLEASQSGTIPICRAIGIPVLVTPVGGLIEQATELPYRGISENLSAENFADHIELATCSILEPGRTRGSQFSEEHEIRRSLIMACLGLNEE